jgi:hypothetical protein
MPSRSGAPRLTPKNLLNVFLSKTSTAQNPRWPPGEPLGFCIPDCIARTDLQIDLKYFCGHKGKIPFRKPALPQLFALSSIYAHSRALLALHFWFN